LYHSSEKLRQRELDSLDSFGTKMLDLTKYFKPHDLRRHKHESSYRESMVSNTRKRQATRDNDDLGEALSKLQR
jgi:hypothetical protein